MLVKCSRQSFLNNCKHFENIMQWINPAIISNLCIIIYTYLKSQKLESQTSDPGYKAGSGDETTSIIHVIEKRKEKPILYQKNIAIHVLKHVNVDYKYDQFQRNLVKNINQTLICCHVNVPTASWGQTTCHSIDSLSIRYLLNTCPKCGQSSSLCI